METLGKQPDNVMRTDSMLTAVWDALPAPLRECGVIAGPRLSDLLSEALHQVELQLYAESNLALTRVEREALLDAADLARVRREPMVADFLKHFEDRYIRACQYQPTVISGYRIDFDPSQLMIVEHSLLDDSLRPGHIEEAIQNASWNTLNALTICFGRMLGNASIKTSEIPLSPKLIEAAVTDALREQPWRHDAKYRLVGSLRRVLAQGVNQLYRDLAEHFRPTARQTGAAKADVPTAPPVQPEDQPEAQHSDLPSETHSGPPDVAPPSPAPETIESEACGEDAPRQGDMPSPQDAESAPELQDTEQTLTEPTAQPEQVDVCPPDTQIPPETADGQENLTQEGPTLAELERGTCLEFREADGQLKELKLSWISPRKSLYLMTDNQGARALSISAEDLATALLDGRVRIVNHPGSQ